MFLYTDLFMGVCESVLSAVG